MSKSFLFSHLLVACYSIRPISESRNILYSAVLQSQLNLAGETLNSMVQRHVQRWSRILLMQGSTCLPTQKNLMRYAFWNIMWNLILFSNLIVLNWKGKYQQFDILLDQKEPYYILYEKRYITRVPFTLGSATEHTVSSIFV